MLGFTNFFRTVLNLFFQLKLHLATHPVNLISENLIFLNLDHTHKLILNFFVHLLLPLLLNHLGQFLLYRVIHFFIHR